MRILALVPDAFGGTGGIALYNRDFLTALCSLPGCREVVALPRLMPRDPEPMPDNLSYLRTSLGGKGNFVKALLKLLASDRAFDLVVCGHLNLLPLAWLAKLATKAPLLLEIYGIDAWEPTVSRLTNLLVGKVDRFVSISDITKQRFLRWAALPEEQGDLLPNAIHLEQYGPGPKNPDLVRRYGLGGKRVLMTLGRLDAGERYKGFDQVLDVLGELAGTVPEISYLVVGSGNDLPRLQEKARDLGVAERVVFAGYVPEAEKADHYRLADVYVMPSSGEGFGFVFLEALACGVPAIGSTVDGSREALRMGELGALVDPAQPGQLTEAVLATLQQPAGVPGGLEFFSFTNFQARLRRIVAASGVIPAD